MAGDPRTGAAAGGQAGKLAGAAADAAAQDGAEPREARAPSARADVGPDGPDGAKATPGAPGAVSAQEPAEAPPQGEGGPSPVSGQIVRQRPPQPAVEPEEPATRQAAREEVDGGAPGYDPELARERRRKAQEAGLGARVEQVEHGLRDVARVALALCLMLFLCALIAGGYLVYRRRQASVS
jgi:hypothetical protein